MLQPEGSVKEKEFRHKWGEKGGSKVNSALCRRMQRREKFFVYLEVETRYRAKYVIEIARTGAVRKLTRLTVTSVKSEGREMRGERDRRW